MRPTSPKVLYRWHAAAVEVGPVPVEMPRTPRCGYYRVTMPGAHAPVLPAHIWARQVIDARSGHLVEPESLQADLSGLPIPAEAIWPRCQPIPRAEYEAMMADLGIAAIRDAD